MYCKTVQSTYHDWLFRVKDRVVRHGPLLGEGEAAQLGRLLEGLLELERHVLRAEIKRAAVRCEFCVHIFISDYKLGL